MSKTHPNPGKLKKEFSVTIGSQESAYRTLLSVPFLSKKDRGVLMRAVVAGPELSWIRLAFKKGLLPARTAVRRTSTERFLAGSGAENAMLLLRNERGADIRLRAIQRLSQNPQNAYMALRGEYLGLTQKEATLLLEVILPILTIKKANVLMEHIRGNGFPRKARAKAVAAIRKLARPGEYLEFIWDVVFLLQQDAGCKLRDKLRPRLSLQERSDVLYLLSLQPSWGVEVLLDTLEKRTDYKLTEAEQRALIPSLITILCGDEYYHILRNRKSDIENMLKLATVLTEEQRGLLEGKLTSLQKKAA